MRYSQSQLPGEERYKSLTHFYKEVISNQRAYQVWRYFEAQPFNLGGCNDIDALMSDQMNTDTLYHTEFDSSSGDPYCLLEMKHANTPDRVIDNLLISKLPVRKLADNSNIPFFIVKYYPKEEFGAWNFKVYPNNKHANDLLVKTIKFDVNKKYQLMSEREYVGFLFYLHKEKQPDSIKQVSNQRLAV